MRAYCGNCQKEVETKTITKQETYPVLGENIEITADVLVCKNCGAELFSFQLDTENLKRAYSVYRKKHKLLFPEEIKAIREQYGLSQRGFSKLLNWGDKTIRRYENGSVQDKAHNSLLLFLRKPSNMKEYLNENDVSLDAERKKALLDKVDSLIYGDLYSASESYSVSLNIELDAGSIDANEFNYAHLSETGESNLAHFANDQEEEEHISYAQKNSLSSNDAYAMAA